MVANVFRAALVLDTEVADAVAKAELECGDQARKGDLASFSKWPLVEPLKVVTVDVSL